MIRKALLIGAPGDDLPGVTKDIANLKDFLLSDAGGAWESREIETLIDPSRILVDSKLSALSLSDYSFVFFAGHGRHHVERNMTQLQNGQVLSIKQAHELGSIKVKRVSNNRQNPVAVYPRSLLHFPFAVK